MIYLKTSSHAAIKLERCTEHRRPHLKISIDTLIGLLDLTSLNDDDTPADIHALCSAAQTEYGPVAAVCVMPRFVSLARESLADSSIAVATVVNFPYGDQYLPEVNRAIATALDDGAGEIDAVIPYRHFLRGDVGRAGWFVESCRRVCDGRAALKVILETGELADADRIAAAARLAIDCGADFIKTSTGKAAVNATPKAAAAMLNVIRQMNPAVGFKAAGGISTMDQAIQYVQLAQEICGPAWVDADHFRLGASSLLPNLLAEAG